MTINEFLKYIIDQIVDKPEEVVISEQQITDSMLQYTVSANKEDIGKIIGKEGKIIQAIRNIAKILAIKEGKQIRIEIA